MTLAITSPDVGSPTLCSAGALHVTPWPFKHQPHHKPPTIFNHTPWQPLRPMPPANPTSTICTPQNFSAAAQCKAFPFASRVGSGCRLVEPLLPPPVHVQPFPCSRAHSLAHTISRHECPCRLPCGLDSLPKFLRAPVTPNHTIENPTFPDRRLSLCPRSPIAFLRHIPHLFASKDPCCYGA